MDEGRFFVENRDKWVRLQRLADALDKAPQRLKREEVLEFITLYRSMSADISALRGRNGNPDLVDALNTGLASAYSALYRRPTRSFWPGLGKMLEFGAQAFRRRFGYVLTALGVLVIGGVFSFSVLQYRPDLRSEVIPREMEPLFDKWKEGQFDATDSGTATGMYAMYASHNPLVAVMSGSIGAGTFGVGSVALLWENGSVLGSLTYEMKTVGKTGFLYSSLAPHGATEMSGAIIASTSGLIFGAALINPKQRRRIDSLRVASKDAFALLIMGILMMYIAAPFEAYFSFRPEVPQWFKAIVGIVVFSCWCAYWMFAGRGTKEASVQTAKNLSRQIREQHS